MGKRVVLAAVVAAAVTDGAAPAATGLATFQTPSRNIVCTYAPARVFPGEKAGGDLECGIKSGLVGAPVPKCHVGDPVINRINARDVGRGERTLCAGDPGPFVFTHAPVLAYGRTWHGGKISCTSERVGLTCKNTEGHGFFLSRQAWHLF